MSAKRLADVLDQSDQRRWAPQMPFVQSKPLDRIECFCFILASKIDEQLALLAGSRLPDDPYHVLNGELLTLLRNR